MCRKTDGLNAACNAEEQFTFCPLIGVTYYPLSSKIDEVAIITHLPSNHALVALILIERYQKVKSQDTV